MDSPRLLQGQRGKVLTLIFLLSNLYGYSQQPAQGLWRGVIHYDSVAVPFQFEVDLSSNEPSFVLINGGEHKRVTNFKITGDSIFIPMGVFDSQIEARFTAHAMQGKWVKFYRDSPVKFTATYHASRFKNAEPKPTAVAPKWQLTFTPKMALPYKGVGLWEQEGQKVTGTIMTEVSDYRYFEGVATGDSIKLSSFDGAHAFLILGKKNTAGWVGEMHFDNGYKEPWIAVASDTASLPDPWQVVNVKPGTERPFYDILGAGAGKDAIDPSDYFNKVLIIQLFGTWCPNSLDETRFLIDWYNAHKGQNVAILGVSFEANYSRAYGLKRIREYKEALRIPYRIVLGGQLSKGQAALAFPFMDRIQAFPTLVVVDKFGYVRYVHSYFNGPATGTYFEDFKQSFNQKVDKLLAE